MVKISIILPTRDGSDFISAAILSVEKQTFQEWELIIIDDGSTDNTSEIVKIYCGQDSRIKYFKNYINLGIAKTLNKGLELAEGKYIARIDDDDEWSDKDKLKKQFDFLKSHINYVLVGTNAIFVDDLGREVFRLNQPQEDIDIRRYILKRNCFVHSSVLFNKNAVVKYGGYNELLSHKHIEDYDLWLKLGLIGKVYNLQDYSVKCLINQKSITTQHQKEQYLKDLYIIGLYKNKYPKYFIAYFYRMLKLVLFGYLGFLPIFNRKNQFKYKKILQKKATS